MLWSGVGGWVDGWVDRWVGGWERELTLVGAHEEERTNKILDGGLTGWIGVFPGVDATKDQGDGGKCEGLDAQREFIPPGLLQRTHEKHGELGRPGGLVGGSRRLWWVGGWVKRKKVLHLPTSND